MSGPRIRYQVAVLNADGSIGERHDYTADQLAEAKEMYQHLKWVHPLEKVSWWDTLNNPASLKYFSIPAKPKR